MDTEPQLQEAVQVEEVVESGTSVTWMLIYTAVVLIAINQLWSFSHFWRMGVPGPFPLPFAGNFFVVMTGVIPAFVKWTKKYGKYYGIYYGKTTALIICDADLARQILIKDFPSFQSRNIGGVKMPFLDDSIVNAHGEVWKRGRSYISPTFSGSKMKQMVPDINSKCDIMIEVLREKATENKSVDTKALFGSYVLDIVARCAYGLASDCQRDENDIFLVNSKKLTKPAMLGLLLRFAFPITAPFLDKFSYFDVMDADALDFFADCVKKTMEMRKESGESQGKKDFLQLMMDAAEAGGEDPVNGEETNRVESTVPKKKIPLTQKELIGQSLLFFFAGYETVSSTMSFAAYAIAKYPEVQKKLQEELDKLTGEEEISYQDVTKLEYLDKVWCESQRMWPFAFGLERNCTQEFTHNGKTIPKGQYLNVLVFDIHRNPEYWGDNPDTFNPENFSKEAKESRHPCAFMPFGAGPRSCVATRFAILQGKIGLARILQKFTLQLDPQTPDLDDVNNLGSQSAYPDKGIHVQLVPREQ